MKNLIDKGKKIYLKYKSQILYLFFGGLSTLLNIVIFFIFNTLIKIDYQTSNVIAWIIVVIFAYITNKIWVFESKKETKSELLKETVSFFGSRLLTLGIEFILLYLFVEKFNILELVSKIIINIVVIVLNYVLSKLFVFKKKNNQVIKNTQKKNKIIELVAISVITFTVISVFLYKYEINENGYTRSYFITESTKKGELSQLKGELYFDVHDGYTITSEIKIIKENSKYLYINFHSDYINSITSKYKIRITDRNGTVIYEEFINDRFITGGTYKIEIPNLKKGNYNIAFKYSGNDSAFSPTYNSKLAGDIYLNGSKINGVLDIEVLYKENSIYTVLYIFIFVLTSLFLVYLYLINKYDHIHIEKKFLFLAIPIFAIYFVVIPPNAGHDEELHWYRIFEISEGGFVSSVDNGSTGYILPENVDIDIPWIEQFRYINITNNKKVLDYNKKIFVANGTMAVYSPIQYLPQVTGVFVTKHITNKPLTIYYVGRLCNLIACIVLLYLAIKIIPYYKKILFLLAFIPIAIEGFTTLSGDGMLIAISYLFIAYVLKQIEISDKLKLKNYIIIILLGSFIALSKLVYIPIIGLLLLLPSTKFKNKKGKIIKLFILFAVLLGVNTIWNCIANQYLETYTQGKSSFQIQNILYNPIKYFQIFMYTLEREGLNLIEQIFGKYLLWGELCENYTIVPLLLGVVSIILAVNDNNKKQSKKSIIVMSMISLIIIALIFTSIYIQWITVGSDYIYGIQGRYFLAIMPLVLIVISNIVRTKIQISDKILNKILIYTCVLVNYITIMELVIMFL